MVTKDVSKKQLVPPVASDELIHLVARDGSRLCTYEHVPFATSSLSEVTCNICFQIHLQDCITSGILTIAEAQAMWRCYRVPESWEHIERTIENNVG